MTRSGWLLVFLSAIFTVIANILLRYGVDLAGGFLVEDIRLFDGVKKLLLQPAFSIGLFFYGVASLIWFRVLSTEQLSIAYPVLVSSTFFFVTICAVLIFKEPVNAYKLIGLFVICSGIIIIAQS